MTNGSFALASIAHDTYMLAGTLDATPPVSITFAFYSQADCGGSPVAVANTGADEGDATADRSAASAALRGRSYSSRATLADDANYLGDSSHCAKCSVAKAQLTASPKLPDSS